MGLLDFLRNREGDFVKMDKAQKPFGPGPLLLLYQVPPGLATDEVYDMIHDGAPRAHAAGCAVVRLLDNKSNRGGLDSETGDNDVLDLPLEQALNTLLSTTAVQQGDTSLQRDDDAFGTIQAAAASTGIISTPQEPASSSSRMPLLFFSGFHNDEMMNVYNIVGGEIYQEMMSTSTGTSLSSSQPPPAACAKAVPNAMNKPLRQVLEEIAGDHQDAMRLSSSDEEV